MPEQAVGQAASETWTQESVEKQAVELEKQQPEKVEKPVVAEDAETVEAKEKVEKVVPQGALHEERARRRQEAQRANNAEQRAEQYQRQMLEMLSRMGQPQQQVDPNDPNAVARNEISQIVRAEIKPLTEAQQRDQQAAYQRSQYDQFRQTVSMHEAEFAKEQPDYTDAVKFLSERRASEYVAAGYTQQQAAQLTDRDAHQFAAMALQNGESPAKAAFDMAASRGYVSPKQKLEMQKAGQGASLPSGGGKSGGLPSLEALLKMPRDEFAKATEGGKWEQLLKRYS